MRIAVVAVSVVLVLAACDASYGAGWEPGEFLADGKPVEEHHCVPSGVGPFPAVIMLHGAGPRNAPIDDFEDLCLKLADSGYYGEFLEYYSQTGAASPGDMDEIARDFPTWLSELHAGVEELKKNRTVRANQIGLMGYSLGAYLSLSYGATYPDQIAAIVEYYGSLAPALQTRVAMIPPVLIIHGDIDRIVPVSEARDLDAMLTKAGRPHEMKIYPGAEHGFNFPGAMFWYKPGAANDAFDRSIKFFDNYLKPASK